MRHFLKRYISSENLGLLLLLVILGFGVIFTVSRNKQESLALIDKIKVEENKDISNTEFKTAVMGGGCFWCTEADFEKLSGVISVISGYTGSDMYNPTYDNYADRGFREVVLITYDPKIVSFGSLVLYLIKHSDPTDGEGSFHDRGPQYAPAVYYSNPEEKDITEKVIKDIDAKKIYDKPLAIKVLPIGKFWPAEEYHQDYYKKNPLRYSYYRNASGRDAFIQKYWGTDTGVDIKKDSMPWTKYKKPSADILKQTMDSLAYNVTQENGTERPLSSPLDKNWDEGIYVDVLSGEPLYSSKDKFDSGTGWPSFVKPITKDAVVLRADTSLLAARTEVRSRYSDSHLGHVFPDGPADRGGLRYCMNGVALKFIPKADMEKEGYGDYLKYLN